MGHALKNDLRVLLLDHPRRQTRDTALHRPLTRPLHNERAQDTGINARSGEQGWKELCAQHLGLEIQGGEHSSVDDARAGAALYQKNQRNWEREFCGGAAGWRQGRRGGKKKGSAGVGSKGALRATMTARSDDDDAAKAKKARRRDRADPLGVEARKRWNLFAR